MSAGAKVAVVDSPERANVNNAYSHLLWTLINSPDLTSAHATHVVDEFKDRFKIYLDRLSSGITSTRERLVREDPPMLKDLDLRRHLLPRAVHGVGEREIARAELREVSR